MRAFVHTRPHAPLGAIRTREISCTHKTLVYISFLADLYFISTGAHLMLVLAPLASPYGYSRQQVLYFLVVIFSLLYFLFLFSLLYFLFLTRVSQH